MTNITDIIRSSGLTATENRKKVLAVFHKTNQVLSLKEMKASAVGINRISLYRMLKSFVCKGLIHIVSDGTKHPKYALCYRYNHQNNHAHFHCTTCEKTICLNQVSIPELANLPKGYQINKANLIISGVCEACT